VTNTYERLWLLGFSVNVVEKKYLLYMFISYYFSKQKYYLLTSKPLGILATHIAITIAEK